MTDVKSLADKKMRDIEREKKVALEVQARSYDQRIAQLEMQHRERETRVADGYESQIESLRNANARLIQKKS